MTQRKDAIKFGILLFIFSAIIVNILTIYSFPSWFDEAYYANISFNLANGKGFLQDLIPGYNNGQVLIYGPVYFFLQAQLIHLFGLDEFIFRLPNLLAGYISVVLLYKILQDSGCKKIFALLFLAGAIADVSFNRNLVYGRMDLVALMFVMMALYLAQRIEFKSRLNLNLNNLVIWSLVGLISTAAYLTTPRSLFLLPIVFSVAFYKIFVERERNISLDQLGSVLGASLAFLIPILFWIHYAGGFEQYTDFFQSRENVRSHIGVSFFRSFYDNISIGIFIILVLIYFRTVLKKPLLVGVVLTYLSFSIFVEEVGPYAAMITPILIAAIFLILSETINHRIVRYSLTALIVLPGVFLVFLRGADLIVNTDCRNSSNIPKIISHQSNQKIITPFKYYFFAEGVNREVITFERSQKDAEELIKDADLIIASQSRAEFLNTYNFKEVAKTQCNHTKLPFLPDTFYDRSTFSERFFSRK